MREVLGESYEATMSDVNRNVVYEFANYVLIGRDTITVEEFHVEMDRLLNDRDTLIVELSQGIIAHRNDERVRPLVSTAVEALMRESRFRSKPGVTYDLEFVRKFFGKVINVNNN